MNKLRGVFNVVVTKAPSFGDRKIQLLKDIACITGATFVSTTKGDDLTTLGVDGLGKCAKAIINQNKTVIIDGAQDTDVVVSYAEGLKTLLDNETITYEKEKYRERIAKILGGVALIKVGAATEVELQDKKLRIEDALSATKAAVEEGIVAGGGTALINVAPAVEKTVNELTGGEKLGATIVLKALEEPVKQIARNAGLEPAVIADNVKKSEVGVGFDASKEEYVDMKKSGIVDPTKVTRSALQNAASIASMVITTESLVADIPEKDCHCGHDNGMGAAGMEGMY